MQCEYIKRAWFKCGKPEALTRPKGFTGRVWNQPNVFWPLELETFTPVTLVLSKQKHVLVHRGTCGRRSPQRTCSQQGSNTSTQFISSKLEQELIRVMVAFSVCRVTKSCRFDLLNISGIHWFLSILIATDLTQGSITSYQIIASHLLIAQHTL